MGKLRFNARKHTSVQSRILRSSVEFTKVLEQIEPDYVYIEDVEFWLESTVSMTAAVRGDLFLLTKLIGAYGLVCAMNGIRFEYLSPRRWKGQMNKEAVANLVLRKLGMSFRGPKGGLDDHTTDAVGMGLSLQGEFNYKRRDERVLRRKRIKA
jgi:Holliday junction resolvasome RuvABC endonuclease subunit